MRLRRRRPAFGSVKHRRQGRAATGNMALVVGSTGVVGAALLDILLNPDAPAGPRKAARPPCSASAEASSSITNLAVRLELDDPAAVHLDIELADPAAVAHAVAPLTNIDHVFCAVWLPFPNSTEELAREANCSMLRGVLTAVVTKCPALVHVCLQTGGKHFIDPFETLAGSSAAMRLHSEDLPRLDYHGSEDALPDGAAITWSIENLELEWHGVQIVSMPFHSFNPLVKLNKDGGNQFRFIQMKDIDSASVDQLLGLIRDHAVTEVEFVEFECHGAGVSVSVRGFHLFIKLKNEQGCLFRNIHSNGHHNLFKFIRNTGAADVLHDTEIESIKNDSGDGESDDEDNNLVVDRVANGSPVDSYTSGERMVWNLEIWRNLLAVLFLLSLLPTSASASTQHHNGFCPIEPMISYILPRTTCPTVHVAAEHWVHAKRINYELTIFNLDFNPCQSPHSCLDLLGLLLVLASCITPLNYIRNININLTITIFSWETKMSYVWASNLISSIVYYISWMSFDLFQHYEDPESTKSAWHVIYKDLLICVVNVLLLGILGYQHRVAIQIYLHTRKAIRMWATLIICSICWTWLCIIFDIQALGLVILAWISMVPMYFTKWVTVKRFEWIPFMLKVGGFVGLIIIHEDGQHLWYERAYKVGILCKFIELMISGYPLLKFLKSMVMNRLHR
ncbi:unnamed protein product [Urochloa decumbens]|uniref:Uncharacterized protein n=1 Tax=Urochloa decumbens TaxID=240449 RepID=A0ABC8YR99_9POAL